MTLWAPIMNPTLTFHTCLILLSTVGALVVQPSPERELNVTTLSLLQSQSSPIHRLNQTRSSSGIDANRLSVFCDADEYGRNLLAADCRDAITGIKRSKESVRFGERSADPETWDVGLPSRQIGCKHAVEGTLHVSEMCHLTSKQYRGFAQLNWNSNLAGHPLLLAPVKYPKPLLPYWGSASQEREVIREGLQLT